MAMCDGAGISFSFSLCYNFSVMFMIQLQSFRFGGAWYDLSADERVEAVKRVHDVAFSQVQTTFRIVDVGY